MSVFNFSQSQLPLKSEIDEKPNYKAHIPNINALNSDTHTLRIQYEFTQKQFAGVVIEGKDIWYMGLTKIMFAI